MIELILFNTNFSINITIFAGATKEQRGFKITENIFEDGTTENNNCYEFSPRTMNFIGKYQCILKYCPLIPKILETTDEFDLRMSEIATESKEIQ